MRRSGISFLRGLILKRLNASKYPSFLNIIVITMQLKRNLWLICKILILNFSPNEYYHNEFAKGGMTLTPTQGFQDDGIFCCNPYR